MRPARAAVGPHQGADHGVQHDVAADRLGDDAVGPGLERLPHHLLVGVGRDQDARQQGVELVYQGQRLQAGQLRHVQVEQGQVDRAVLHNVQGLLAAGGQVGRVTFRLEDLPQGLAAAAVAAGAVLLQLARTRMGHGLG